MIITKIKEGMGNQLFQYATAKSLSLQHNVPLAMDVSHYFRSGHRKFELPYFNIPEINIDLEPFRKLSFYLYREPYFHYDPTLREIKGNLFLDGFWQSENYFKDIRSTLLEEFTVKQEYVSHLELKAQEIRCENSVAVHVRRGDYLSKRFSDSHGVLHCAYYRRAMELLEKELSPIKFYFFSDDIDWLKDNIHTDHAHEYVSGAQIKNHIEEFYLMVQCRHQVIANSSYSWWAAWLNDYSQKKVVAPKKWFNNLTHNTKDLVPETWARI